jgi:hypothetical protein
LFEELLDEIANEPKNQLANFQFSFSNILQFNSTYFHCKYFSPEERLDEIADEPQNRLANFQLSFSNSLQPSV